MDVLPTTELRPDDHAEGDAQKAALTPPTSEDMDNKRERSSSELSELDLDSDAEDDIGEIVPDHYYGGGKVPVFKPTMQQFRSFKKFIDKVDDYGMKSGIVKVIPPKEWRDSLPELHEAVKTIKVKNPITQDFSGRQGQYTQQNMEKQRSYNLPQWKALTEELDHQPPAKRGERRRGDAPPARTRASRSSAAAVPSSAATEAPKRGRGRPSRKSKDAGSIKEESPEATRRGSLSQVPPTPKSPVNETAVNKKIGDIKKEEKPRGRQPKSISSRRKNNTTDQAEDFDEKAFKDFDYHLDGLEEFTEERCQELEQNYWKTINFGQPMYGADMPGSLFDDRTTSWNVAHLENILDVLKAKVPGVNTAYLYLGMWKATFAWHLEDVDLYSINYIHFGAPKQWYSISQEDARKFEKAMSSIWPNDAKNCSQFLRHKTYLISPARLEHDFGIKVNKLVHYEGEFVLTYPYGYHSGYNLGYNCAESVNFATEKWLEYGKIAKKCNCEDDSVWVDVHDIERRLRGEPTPEYYEETDEEEEEEDDLPHDLPSPPASVKGKPKAAPRKRKRESGIKEEGAKVKRVKLRIKIPRAEPCVLCPNEAQYDILLPTDNGKQAHRLCALYTPETFIVDDEKEGERVCNVANIDKARLELKCNFCRTKRGACFQCSSKKCTRAFHATCAAPGGVQIDTGPVPTFDEDGTEYYCEGYDFRCRFHRPKRAKNIDVDALEDNKLPVEFAKTLEVKSVVQAQYLVGEVFAGVVVENRPSELSVIIDVLPDAHERIEVEWKYLLALDPADSLRPKPSENAKPLPEDLNRKPESLNARNQKDGPPEADDAFGDPTAAQKWAEFHTCTPAEASNPFQAKVDLSKEYQPWHYLGKTSTEARAQYTDDPKKTVHNPKSNFLDTVKPPPRVVQPVDRRSLAASHPKGANANGATGLQRQSMQPQPRPYEYKPRSDGSYAMDPRQQHSGAYYPGQPYRHPSQHMAPPSQHYGGQMPNRSGSAHQQNPQYPYQHGQYGGQPFMHAERRPSFTSTSYDPARYQSRPQYQQPSLPPYHQSPFAQRPEERPATQSHYQPYQPGQSYHVNPYGQQQTPQNQAPTAPMMGGTPPVSASPYSRESVASRPVVSHSPAPEPLDLEYLQYISQYPYLKNAYLRRPKTYESPYPGTSGFSERYMPKKGTGIQLPPPSSFDRVPRSWQSGNYPGSNAQAPGYPGPYATPTPASSGGYQRPGLTFQSPADFQKDVSRTYVPPMTGGGSKFEMLLKQLSATNEAAQQRRQSATPSFGQTYMPQHQPSHYPPHPQQHQPPPPQQQQHHHHHQPPLHHQPHQHPQPQQPLQHPHQTQSQHQNHALPHQPQQHHHQPQEHTSPPHHPPRTASLSNYTGPSNTRGYRPGYGYDSGAFGPATHVKPSLIDPALATPVPGVGCAVGVPGGATAAPGVAAMSAGGSMGTATPGAAAMSAGAGMGTAPAPMTPARGRASPVPMEGVEMGGGTPKQPVVSPLSDVGGEAMSGGAIASAGAAGGRETWRY